MSRHNGVDLGGAMTAARVTSTDSSHPVAAALENVTLAPALDEAHARRRRHGLVAHASPRS